ncbi:MAG: hypothetical protein ACAH80_17145 [Alphaproteobacteria bacterium]
MGEIAVLQDFQLVAFYIEEKPAYFDSSQPGSAAKQLATDLFDIKQTDLNPAHPGKYYGKGNYGFVFEVQVKTSIALVLATRNLSNVLQVYQ